MLLQNLQGLLLLVAAYGIAFMYYAWRDRTHKPRILKMLSDGVPDNNLLGDILAQLPTRRMNGLVPVLACNVGDYRVEHGSKPAQAVDAVLETVRIMQGSMCLLTLSRPRMASGSWFTTDDSVGGHLTGFLRNLRTYCCTVQQCA